MTFGLFVGCALALFAVGVWSLMHFLVCGPRSPRPHALALAMWSLVPLPLLVWVGEILFRSRLSEDMFTGLAPWLNKLPGRLLHVTIVGSGIFWAGCGFSAVTAATIGRISILELRKQG